MQRPSENWAIVTGASSGIGKEFAYYFARNFHQLQANLILIARREHLLSELKEEIIRENGIIKIETIKADLFESEEVQKAFEQASHSRRITYLINNAGRGQYGDFTRYSLHDHTQTLSLNVTGLTQLSYLFIEHARRHDQKSHIINIASIAAYHPLSAFALYSASKSFVKSFSLGLRANLKHTNIKVSCVCPGGTYTEFMSQSGQNLTRNAHYSMMSAEKVVAISMKNVFKNKAIILPGLINKIISLLPRLFPEFLLVKLASALYEKNVKAPK